jgi:hypothetical protein
MKNFKFPTAVAKRIAECNELIAKCDEMHLLPSGFCGSTHESYLDLEPISVKNQFVYFTNKSEGMYNYICGKYERLNANDEDGLEAIKYYLRDIKRTLNSTIKRGY